MTDQYLEKLKEQMEIVLKGERNLLASAEHNHVDIDRIEQQIKDVMAQGVIFGTGDQIVDIMLAAYWTGRRHQWMATVAHLIGQDKLKSMHNQMCIKLGIPLTKLN